MSRNNAYACLCNDQNASIPGNIYASGGCQHGGDCIWSLVSDVVNGVDGDSGYHGCMTSVPGVVKKGQPNLNSTCSISVERVLIRGNETSGRMVFSSSSPPECDAFTL